MGSEMCIRDRYWEKRDSAVAALGKAVDVVASWRCCKPCCRRAVVDQCKLRCGDIASSWACRCCCGRTHVGVFIRRSAARLRASTVTNWRENPLDSITRRDRNGSEIGQELASVSTRRHLERLETGNLERPRGTSTGVSLQVETIAGLRAEIIALQEELRASRESRNSDRARY